jgi:glycosyltransferase involved in cell wall biosynthesis
MGDVADLFDILILIPVFNDWVAVAQLLEKLDQALNKVDGQFRVLLVDDGSTIPLPDEFGPKSFQRINQVDVLELRRNLGHQRAIAVGLCFTEAKTSCAAVVIMDGDGEDAPEDVPRLLHEFQARSGQTVVFAERTRRSESSVFTFFYHFYRLVHFLLTGIKVRVGNFSVIPCSLLSRLVVVSDLWNHYAASVFKSKLPHVSIPTQRATRLGGRSSMDFAALVMHGLSAISVFGDRVGVRMLIVCAILGTLILSSLAAIVVIQLATELAIPGWVIYTSGLMLVILIQLFSLLLFFTLVILSGRESSSFLPARDYEFFVSKTREIFPRDE